MVVKLAFLLGCAGVARADSFGTTGNEFTIDFVTIGNQGNTDDVNNQYNNPGDQGTPFGGVGYTYRIGTYEISEALITRATASGLANVTAGAWTGNQPAGNMTWYEVAAFVNFLNTSTGHQAAYNLNGSATALTLWSSGDAWQLDGENLYRHKNAYYFLPSEDEWYKSAYHKNDGATANYWDYATGSNTIPTEVASGTGAGTAVYNTNGTSLSGPAAVNIAGGLSGYGTMGQGGNVYEWMESANTSPNDVPTEQRAIRGGFWNGEEIGLRSGVRSNGGPSDSQDHTGFRVASVVPEPTTVVSLLLGLGVLAARRNRWALRQMQS